jgi:hypothetical protein
VELLLLLLLEHAEPARRHWLLSVRGTHLGGRRRVDKVLASGGVVVNLLLLLLLLLLLSLDSHGRLNTQLLLHLAELLLLLVDGHLLLHELRVVQIQLLELLGSGLDATELLLQALLLGSQVHVGCDKLRVNAWVHLLLGLLINAQLRGGKNLINSVLLAHHELLHVVWLLLLLLLLLERLALPRLLHLLVLLMLLDTVLGKCGLGGIVDVVLSDTVDVGSQVAPGVLLGGAIRGRGSGCKRRGGGRFGGRSQTSKQVRAAGAGRGDGILLVAGVLVKSIEGEWLDVLATAARSQAPRVAEPVLGSKVVGRHVSKTTGVHGSRGKM